MESIIYTDGHETKVTTSQFITGKANYLIDGIVNARMNLIKPRIAAPIMLIFLGLFGIAAGFFHLFNNLQVDSMHIGTLLLTPNRIAALIGLVLFLTGLGWLAYGKRKYAVQITTSEGEKMVIVSTQKDYVDQIVSAINKALNIRERKLHTS